MQAEVFMVSRIRGYYGNLDRIEIEPERPTCHDARKNGTLSHCLCARHGPITPAAARVWWCRSRTVGLYKEGLHCLRSTLQCAGDIVCINSGSRSSPCNPFRVWGSMAPQKNFHGFGGSTASWNRRNNFSAAATILSSSVFFLNADFTFSVPVHISRRVLPS